MGDPKDIFPDSFSDEKFFLIANQIFASSESKFEAIGLRGGIAVGIRNLATDDYSVISHTANKSGRGGWIDQKVTATEIVISSLSQTNNVDRKNVRVFDLGDNLLAIGVTSVTGTGDREGDDRVNASILNGILEEVLS
jgi:hypothetical protein